MGAANGTHYVGDIVTPTKPIEGLEMGQHYKIRKINRGLDGACDWDDIYLEGKSEWFCEFHLNTVERGNEYNGRYVDIKGHHEDDYTRYPELKPLLNIRQILEYYANEEGYILKTLGRDGEWWVRDGEIVRSDRGQKAREALKELGDLAVTIEVTDEMEKAGYRAQQDHNDKMDKLGLPALGDYKGIFKAMLRAWKAEIQNE